MARYAMTTYFNAEEWNIVENLAKTKGISRYKLLKDAVMAYCEVCQKEKKHDEQTRNGNPSGESPQIAGETIRSDSGVTKDDSEPKLSLAEAANHPDPLDIGL